MHENPCSYYQILGDYRCNIDAFSIVSIRRQDIESIRIWRNEQMDILRQNEPISKKQQIKYFNEVVIPSFKSISPNIVLFSYLVGNECIGYGGLVHIDWGNRDAEISFLLKTEFSKNIKLHQYYFDVFLKLLENTAFNKLNLRKIHTEAYDIRPWHIEIIEKNGFKFLNRIKNTTTVNGVKIDSLVHVKTKEMAG